MSYKHVTIFENDVLIKSSVQPSVYGKGDLEIEGDTLIRGNLTVQGVQSDHQVETFIVEDNIIAIGEPPITSSTDGGMLISRHIDDITSGKVTESSTAQSGTTTTITLNPSANAANNYYNNWYIKIISGPGAGEKKVITAYNGSTKVATVDSAWVNIPTTSTYNLYNKARIGVIWNETVDEFQIGGTVDNHTAENITISNYCDLHVRSIIQDQKQQCTYYVGKHGDDTKSGRHINEAKQTFGAAIICASTDAPSSANQIVIICMDSCIYTENISIPAWVHVSAQNAKLSGTIILANDSSVNFAEQEISSDTAVTHAGGYAYVNIGYMTINGVANGLSNSGAGSQLKFENKKISVANGTAISNSASGIGYLSITSGQISIFGTGVAIYVGANSITNTYVGQINGSGTALTIDGTLNGHIGKISCATAYNVSGTNNLFINEISGAEITVGTSNRLNAGILISKGDLLTRSTTEYIRHGVGTDTYILQADSTTTSGLKWVNPAMLSTIQLATYTLVYNTVKATNPSYVDIAHFPWLNSRYNTYTNGVLILRVEIADRDLELRLRDVTNGVTLHASDPVVLSSSGTYSILLNANPASDADVQLQVRKNLSSGVNPIILGCVLEYYN